MRIARLIAVTVVAVALILGTAIILAAYLQTRHNPAPAHFVAAPTASSTETNVSPRFLSLFSLFSLSISLSSLCSLFKRGQVGCGGKRKRWICFSPLFFFFFCFTFLRVIDSATPSKSIQSQTPAKRKEVKNVVVFVEKGRW